MTTPSTTPDNAKGVFIPEWAWKALQSVLVVAVLGGYTMLYTMHDDITVLRLGKLTSDRELAKVVAELAERKAADQKIRDDLTTIKTELP